ncbi:MAG TPA: RNA polymerase sigma factor [Terriglobales bacterium]|nr:RNA polymerase sigma factor [Terriglobales bacterium]
MSWAGQAVIAQLADGAELVDVEALVRQHARLVYRVAWSVLRDHHDAEDAAQETFVRLWRSRDQLPQIADPRLWLARVAWRVAVDRVRRRREQPLDDLPEPLAPGDPLDEQVAGDQLRVVMEELIAALPKDMQDVINLSAAGDMSAAELGEILGVAEGTVRTRLHRARQLLRERLAARLERKRIT